MNFAKSCMFSGSMIDLPGFNCVCVCRIDIYSEAGEEKGVGICAEISEVRLTSSLS